MTADLYESLAALPFTPAAAVIAAGVHPDTGAVVAATGPGSAAFHVLYLDPADRPAGGAAARLRTLKVLVTPAEFPALLAAVERAFGRHTYPRDDGSMLPED